jgi:ATP synthase protein I
MSDDKRELFRSLAMASSIGISVVMAIGIGVWLGLTLDRWFGTHPWFFYIFLFIGIAAGFKNIYVIAGREIRRNDDSDKRR